MRPKCLYPELANDQNNIVELTGAEHFKAHYWLWKHYAEETSDKNAAIKMHAPLMRMYQQIRDYLTDEELEAAANIFHEARAEQARINSRRMKGVPRTEEVKRKISETETGKAVSADTRRRLSSALRGNKCALGHRMSAESKAVMAEKLSRRFKGENNPAHGRHWYNDGKKNLYVRDDECPEGYVRGILRRRK